MTFAHAHMRTAGLAAGQSSSANVGAQRNRICTRFTHSDFDGRLAARTRRYLVRHQFASVTRARMAFAFASVIITIQRFVAHFVARIIETFVVLLGAGCLPFVAATIARLLYIAIAFGAFATMAFGLASMDAAVQCFIANFVAFQIVFLAALHGFGAATTTAGACHHCMTRRTWTYETQNISILFNDDKILYEIDTK